MDPIASVPQAPVSAPASQAAGNLEGPIANLKFAWKILTKHWKAIVPILLLPAVVGYIGSLLFMIESITMAVIASIIMIASYILSTASAPASIQAVHRITTDPGTPISLKAQYRFGFSMFWSVILIGIIGTLAGFGSLALLIIPGIIVSVYGSMYAYTLVIDGKKGFSAFTESYSLVRGRWWPVLGNILFMVLVMFVIQLVVMAILFLFSLIFGVQTYGMAQVEPNIGFTLISIILGLLQTAVAGTIGVGYVYKLYSSLKATRAVPAPATKTFKNWIVAFLCIGVLAIIVMFVTVPLLAIGSARYKALDARQNAQERMIEVQRQIEAEQQQ